MSVKQPKTHIPKEFPYKGLNPVANKQVTIENKEDIYEVLMNCYDEAIERGFDVGEALYNQLFFFADPEHIYDNDSQNLIKKYIYCEAFNCPPYPSLQETPATLVDDFLLIKREIAKATKEK